jgi:8-oxo-dGTP diphosphatase
MTFLSPYVTVDIIALRNNCGREEVVLVKRKHEPYQDYLALPGGFLNVGRETVKQAAQREFREETNLFVELEDLVLVGESSNPDRDPRGHIVSLHYFTEKYTGTLKASDDASDAGYFPLDNLPKLAFDHNETINDFKEWRRKWKMKSE